MILALGAVLTNDITNMREALGSIPSSPLFFIIANSILQRKSRPYSVHQYK
ncbi:uncharacterized protein PRCAT00003784001 [Priceomyces carsonii]|uniref:uncharacterized protein n=1 Tax=Priceomyces carsonii TaxID=28549 RepID=UPI002EDB1C83|nr:unnamed protein product [Priceomyces carsonii]